MNSEHPAGYVHGAPAGTYDHSSRECLECACVQPFFKRYKVQEALRCTVCGKPEQHRKEYDAPLPPPGAVDTATQSPATCVDREASVDAQHVAGAADAVLRRYVVLGAYGSYSNSYPEYHLLAYSADDARVQAAMQRRCIGDAFDMPIDKLVHSIEPWTEKFCGPWKGRVL